MDRIVMNIELSSGQRATTVVTPGPILVAIDGRACLAHHRWFNRDEAREMIRSLTVFTDQDQP